MTIQQRAQIERAFDEYMPLYNRFIEEPSPEIRQQLSAQMDEIGRKYGFDGGVGR
ncbi:hypothetical protein M5X00_04470 [Paenibacillus alvei]|uniref:Uncharacterized protein n=1 Tax=Paenibacillus alvei TaxID=44250 RepID=A0ABT4H7S4_PAEAL|nr:hypothetical protein [Paenibacillus alvei]EJW19045.1 hypothetical protein PAV_1c00160 [Paenibacillus alvei DSM 29]MCY9544141.1 hypothetical protein [Paenibacillus alvei]MCY9707554.1 hypothetical protein [Paenibacillus alvei]MCY9737122.1 hypothetical protein [Paenibacillus alvei]MCY9753512.1 hypothetical protein [Paenibacillus alvei]